MHMALLSGFARSLRFPHINRISRTWHTLAFAELPSLHDQSPYLQFTRIPGLLFPKEQRFGFVMQNPIQVSLQRFSLLSGKSRGRGSQDILCSCS